MTLLDVIQSLKAPRAAQGAERIDLGGLPKHGVPIDARLEWRAVVCPVCRTHRTLLLVANSDLAFLLGREARVQHVTCDRCVLRAVR